MHSKTVFKLVSLILSILSINEDNVKHSPIQKYDQQMLLKQKIYSYDKLFNQYNHSIDEKFSSKLLYKTL
jgi:hypothetical protein